MLAPCRHPVVKFSQKSCKDPSHPSKSSSGRTWEESGGMREKTNVEKWCSYQMGIMIRSTNKAWYSHPLNHRGKIPLFHQPEMGQFWWFRRPARCPGNSMPSGDPPNRISVGRPTILPRNYKVISEPHVCIYVCMYVVSMYVCICVCMYVCRYVCM